MSSDLHVVSNGDINGDIGSIFGNVNGSIYGNVHGHVVGNINGSVHGNIDGSVFGNINGGVTGVISGDVLGTINGNVHRINGTVFGKVRGRIGSGGQRPYQTNQDSTNNNDNNNNNNNNNISISIQCSSRNNTNREYVRRRSPILDQMVELSRSIEVPRNQTPITNSHINLIQNDNNQATVADVSCPICLDNVNEIKTKHNRIMSTTCGHIICNVCCDRLFLRVHEVECPNCRTRLVLNQIHDLFI